MQIQNVSFGKIVKVNGSIEEARRIANIANGRTSSKHSQEIKAYFPDIAIGKAVAHEKEHDSFVLTGEHSRRYETIVEDLKNDPVFQDDFPSVSGIIALGRINKMIDSQKDYSVINAEKYLSPSNEEEITSKTSLTQQETDKLMLGINKAIMNIRTIPGSDRLYLSNDAINRISDKVVSMIYDEIFISPFKE